MTTKPHRAMHDGYSHGVDRNKGALKRRGRHEQSWAATEHTQVTANSLTGPEARDGVHEAVEGAWERMANNTLASKNIEYVVSLQCNTVKAI